jgi:hypothetical protein
MSRDHRSSEFSVVLSRIRAYAVRDDASDWKRCLVVGVAFLDARSIAVSTVQLSKLLRKSKSTINGRFKNLGYFPVPMSDEHASTLIRVIPVLRQNSAGVRQWTIRSLKHRPALAGSPFPVCAPPAAPTFPMPLGPAEAQPAAKFPALDLDALGIPYRRDQAE